MTEQRREHADTKGTVSRRAFLKTGGLLGLAGTVGVAGPHVVSAQSRALKIGFIGAQSGVRASGVPFARLLPAAILFAVSASARRAFVQSSSMSSTLA